MAFQTSGSDWARRLGASIWSCRDESGEFYSYYRYLIDTPGAAYHGACSGRWRQSSRAAKKASRGTVSTMPLPVKTAISLLASTALLSGCGWLYNPWGAFPPRVVSAENSGNEVKLSHGQQLFVRLPYKAEP